MIILGIFILAGIIIGVRTSDTDYTVAMIGNGFVGAFIAILIYVCIALMYKPHADYEETITHELVSLNDGSTTSGSFTLGSGYVGEHLTYTFYRKEGEHGIVRRSIRANKTTIYEVDSTEAPKLVVSEVPSGINYNLWLFSINKDCGKEHYDLYIPKGSIVKEFNLDNQ